MTDDERKLFEEVVWREDKMAQDKNYQDFTTRHDEIRARTISKIRTFHNHPSPIATNVFAGLAG